MEEMTRTEHDKFHGEFAARVGEEDKRQNKRLDLLEESISRINDLTVSIERMEVSMSNMIEEIKKQGERLEELENEPVETYNQVKQSIITAVIGTVVGAVTTAVLMLL